jgi:hypothetical protein
MVKPGAGLCHMPSSIVCPPPEQDVKVRSEQELQFDHWRTAVEVVKRLREAGVSCELVGNPKDPH